MSTLPKISIVVPIRNEAKYIAQTIRYLLDQDYPNDKMEILVVVGDSDDNTAEIVQEIAADDERVKYFYNPRSWSSAARNTGTRNATGDIITFVDGHTYIDNDQLLKNTARLIAEKDVSVLSRPQFLDTPENTLFQKAVSLARKSVIGHGLDSTIYTDKDMYVDPASAGAAYKREVFGKVGYFDERFDASEDYEFNYRVDKAGYRSFTSSALAVYYYPRTSLGALFCQMERYGTGRMRLAHKHPNTLGLGTLIPPLFTVGLIALPLLWLVRDLFGYLFVAAYGLYFLTILTSSIAVTVRNGLAFAPLLLLIYPTIHIGLGYGFLVEGLRTLFGQRPVFNKDE